MAEDYIYNNTTSGFLSHNCPVEAVEGKCACDTCSHLVTESKIRRETGRFYISRWCDLGERHRGLEAGYNCRDYNYEIGTDDEEPVPWERRFPPPRRIRL